MKTLNALKKTTASVLALALLLEAPGLRAYAALTSAAASGRGAVPFSIRRIGTPLSLPSSSEFPGHGIAPETPQVLPLSLPNGRLGPAAQTIFSAPRDIFGAKEKTTAPPAGPRIASPQNAEQAAAGRAERRSPLAALHSAAVAPQAVAAVADGSLRLGQADVPAFSARTQALGSLKNLAARLLPWSARSRTAGPDIPSVAPRSSSSVGERGLPPRKPSAASGFAASATRMAVAAASVIALQGLSVYLWPAVFGFIPTAAAWAAMPALLALPAGFIQRYIFSRQDLPGLSKINWVLDGALGALLGASALVLPGLSTALAAPILPAMMSLTAIAGLGTLLTMAGGGRAANFLFSGASLMGLAHFIGVGAAGAISVSSLFALAMVPVIATIAFSSGFLIDAARSGRPFSIPGALLGQKMRFPTFPGVMSGVVFALISGYAAWQATIAFFVWNILGDPKIRWNKSKSWIQNLPALLLNFNLAYAGLFLFSAATGFSSPATFLVLAFLPDRAQHLTEFVLQKILPGDPGAAAAAPPRTLRSEPTRLEKMMESKFPNTHRWLKTASYLALLLTSTALFGVFVSGYMPLLHAAISATTLAVIPFIFSNWIIKKLQQAKDTNPKADPAIYRVVDQLLALINSQRVRAGKKPIPIPEVVILATAILNAFATGPSPFHAMVGVTQGMKDTLFVPGTLRQNLLHAIAVSDPSGASFKALRRTIAETLGGVGENANPQELSQAVSGARDSDLERLGERYLRGVLAHEFSHVTDRHMAVNFIMGSLSNSINFAAYALMWSVVVGHRIVRSAREAVKRVLSPNDNQPRGPSFVGPLAAPALLSPLIRVFISVYSSLFLQIIMTAASRNDEAQADEDGAKLVRDPQALAAALVLLMNWRPKPGASMREEEALRLILNSRMFTVSPAEQLSRAGLFPELQARAQDSPEDNWLFYALNMNHPETAARIQELWTMSEDFKNSGQAPVPMPSAQGAR